MSPDGCSVARWGCPPPRVAYTGNTSPWCSIYPLCKAILHLEMREAWGHQDGLESSFVLPWKTQNSYPQGMPCSQKAWPSDMLGAHTGWESLGEFVIHTHTASNIPVNFNKVLGLLQGMWCGNCCTLWYTGKWWRLEGDGKKALVLVLALISLHMILPPDNCISSKNLAAPSRDGGQQVLSGLVCIPKSSWCYFPWNWDI